MENAMAIQVDFARDTDKAQDIAADYHQGFYNGMALFYSYLTDTNPDFRVRVYKHTKNKVRHRKHK